MAEAAVLGTLSAPLTWGQVYKEASISASTAAIAVGDVLQLGAGKNAQFITVVDADLAGVTEIDVMPFVPNRTYDIGEPVLLSFGGGALTDQYPNADIPGTLKVSGASDLVGNLHEEGALTVDGASTLTGAVAAGGALSVAGAATLNGARNIHVVSKTFADTGYVVLATDYLVLIDATGGATGLTLPTAVGISGREYTFKKTDAVANNVTVTPNGTEKIDGASTLVLTVAASKGKIVSNGANWFTVE